MQREEVWKKSVDLETRGTVATKSSQQLSTLLGLGLALAFRV